MPQSFYSSSNPKSKFINGSVKMVDPVKAKLEGTFDVFKQSPSSATAPVKASPAKQQFIQSQVQSQTQQPQVSQINQPPPGTANGMVTPSTPDPRDSYRSAFNQYIESLKPSNEETQARKYLSDLTLQSKRDQEEALNRGETLGFAAGEAQRANRNNAFSIEAAAGAVDALTGSRTAMTEAQKARLAFEKDLMTSDREDARYQSEQNKPFELGEGQSRYEYDPTTKTYKMTASKGKTYAPSSSGGGNYSSSGTPGQLSPLAQAVQNGTIALDKIPSALRAGVATELATSGIQSPRQQAIQSNLDVVNELLGQDTDAITGAGQNPLNFIGVSNAKSLNLYNQLKGILSLENREKLKGSGAISDFEFKVLQQAASSLGRNLGNQDFRDELQKVKDVFEGRYRQTQAGSGQTMPTTEATPSKGVTPSGIGFQIIQD